MTHQKRLGIGFSHMSGSATRIELLLQLAQLETCVIFAATGSSDDLAKLWNCHLCKRASVPACRLFPSSVQVPSMCIPSFSATLLLYPCPGIDSISPNREIMHEQGTREGAREASVQRMDVAEERVGFLNGHDYRNKCDPISVYMIASHTSVLTDRQGNESGLSSSVVAKSTK
jgi:hypothetical protein